MNAMPEGSPRSGKTELALAITDGTSVTAAARPDVRSVKLGLCVLGRYLPIGTVPKRAV
jgi:hypothetical protein